MSSSFGTLFRVSTFGESHCKAVGVVIDGCPPGLSLTEDDIQPQLSRRRPGQSAISTDRQEPDQVMILSGTENGKTLGTPISLQVANKDQRPKDYSSMRDIPRPSHADYTYQAKYGIRASSGGGRSSARETIGTVAAGAVADKILRETYGIEIVAWVSSVGEIESQAADPETITRDQVEQTTIRCPDNEAASRMEAYVADLKEMGDSIGGVVNCVIRGVPPGIGEPTFEKLEAKLAQGMLAIPATKGFEVGSGFSGTRQRGSIHNDPFTFKDGRLGTVTNNSGGIQGGIANGEPITLRIAFKPPATISLPQDTVDFVGEKAVLEAKGRHDPCVVPRAVPIVESMAALVVMDMVLRQKARQAFAHMF
ncbi:chorismate synthase [Desulforhopalus singaporensis]|uniref:Chorismate synthase n=1 Tax=Desulforhopalus singaporensis TaxID=91360 RepID=A0A1H0K037_9BACT|nr:chorismate synthase [Desulforhopalus singaporensis]SDO49297.1 chorismate synthase [Desulforhopalus singaporensis]